MSTTPASAAPDATPSPIPIRQQNENPGPVSQEQSTERVVSNAEHSKFYPKLRFECRDIGHPGAHIFFSAVNVQSMLSDSVTMALSQLYFLHGLSSIVPQIRSMTLILRAMDGVAYTTSSDLDVDHKEIHFSLNYISNISKERAKDEIYGVLVHELVHVFQYNGQNTMPGGFVEGVADYIRLKNNFAPPHWRKAFKDRKWDQGYETTGYFLAWIEQQYRVRLVSTFNAKLKDGRYNEQIWMELIGKSVNELWEEYGKTVTE